MWDLTPFQQIVAKQSSMHSSRNNISISPIGSSSKVTLIPPGLPLVFQPSPPQIVQPFPPTTPPPCSPPPAPLRNPPPASPRSSAVASWSPDQSSASQGNF